MRKKSCFLSVHVPFVLKLDDVIVTSPSWLPNQFPRHSSGNKQYPSAETSEAQRELSETDRVDAISYNVLSHSTQ